MNRTGVVVPLSAYIWSWLEHRGATYGAVRSMIRHKVRRMGLPSNTQPRWRGVHNLGIEGRIDYTHGVT